VNAEPKRRGRPPKSLTEQSAVAVAEPVVAENQEGGNVMYMLRDKRTGLYVDWHDKLNPVSSARMWDTADGAAEFRDLGFCPDAEEVVPVFVRVDG
jgi:hypothetical protein